MVESVAPAFTLRDGPFVSITEATPITLQVAAVADPSAADTAAGFTYAYDLDNDGTIDVVTGTADPIELPAARFDDGPAVRTVTVRVTDKDGAFTEQTATYAVESAPPTAGVAGAAAVLRGYEYGLTLSAADPSEADTAAGFTFRIDWDGDGTADLTVHGPSGTGVTHRYASAGPRTVRVTATDKDGVASAEALTEVGVTNTGNAPTAGLTGPTAGQAGAAVAVSGSATDPDGYDVPLLVVGWTVTRDGTAVASGTGTAVAFTPTAAGDYLVTLTATDPEGLTGTAVHTVAVAPADDTVDVDGTGEDDVILVDRLSTGMIRVRVNGATVGTYPPAGTLRVFALGGEDIVTVSSAVTRPTVVYGGTGDDTLTGGGGTDAVYGEDGNDVITGGDAADTVSGGAGDDTFRNEFGRGLYDTYDGGPGFDVIEQSRDWHRFARFSPDNAVEGLTIVNPNNGTRRVQGEGAADNRLDFSGVTHVNGVPVAGGAGLDVRGLDGNDTLVGTAGDDTLTGGTGDDRVSGGAGADTVRGNEGGDVLSGGDGNDTLDGGTGADTVRGDAADDVFIANFADHVGDDAHGGGGTNALRLNPGRNQSDPIVLADFGPANGIQRLEGGSRVSGTAGADRLDFSAVTGWTTGRRIDAGDGPDEVTAPSGLGGFAVNGGNGADRLTGGDGADTMDGGEGDDVVLGMGGADLIRGGADENALYGGDGADVFYFHDILEGRWDQEVRDFGGADRLKFKWPVNQTLLFGDAPVAGRFVFSAATGTLFLPNGRRLRLGLGLYDALTQDQLLFGNW